MRGVWVEINERGDPLRVLRNNKEANYRPSKRLFAYWDRAEAVLGIRNRIFDRSEGNCELCAVPVTWDTGHMHEKLPRGKGGEISLENSIFICSNCHRVQHKARNPRWKKKTEKT